MIRRSLRGAAWALLLAALAAPTAWAQAPADLVKQVVARPDSESAAAALAMASDPQAALAAIQETWKSSPPAGVAAARLAAVAVGLGSEEFRAPLLALLEGGTERERVGALEALAHARQVPDDVAAKVASLRSAPEPPVAAAAEAAHAHLGTLGGSSGLWLFLGLVLIAAAAAAWFLMGSVDESGIDRDTLVGWVDEWGTKPGERTQLLTKIRAEVEGPEVRLLGLFEGGPKLTSNQVLALLDLLSHFDVDPVHQKLYDLAGHEDDEIRKGAILAMHRLGDEAWVGVLAEYVRSEDEVARFAGATALARRGAVDQLPLLREEVERTRLGSVRDGMLEAIEKLEALQR